MSIYKSNNLRKILNEKGITPYKLAKCVGMAPPDMYACLNGHKSFFPKWRRNIANYLEMPEYEIFQEVSDNDRKTDTKG